MNASQGKTCGLVTGKSQHSAFDFFEKIETNFLEKYLLYLIKDEMGGLFLNINEIIDNHNLVYLYKVQKSLKMSVFMEQFSKLLNQFEAAGPISPKPKKKDQVFIKIYENEVGKLDQTIQQKELFFVYSKFKVTHQKLKDIGKDIQKKLNREKMVIQTAQQHQQLSQQNQKQSQQQNMPGTPSHKTDLTQSTSSQSAQQPQNSNPNPTINILLYYTGDVNFRFQNDEFLNKNTCVFNGCQFTLRVHIFYISKVALFQYFCQTNNLNIEQIDDKTITLFELRRLSLKRRKQAMQNAAQIQKQKSNHSLQVPGSQKNSQKQQQSSSKKQQNNNNNNNLEDSRIYLKPASSKKMDDNSQNNNNINSGSQLFTNNSQLPTTMPRHRSAKSLDGTRQMSSFAQITLILGLSVGAPFLIRKAMNTEYVKNFFSKK